MLEFNSLPFAGAQPSSVSSHSRHRNMRMEISSGLPELSARYQWFVTQNLETDEQIFYTIDKTPSYYRCRIPELVGRRIRACFHDWVILSSHPKIVTWSLWNPTANKLISLPPLLHEQSDSHECCLSSPPDDPNSIFLLTTQKKPTIVFCRINVKRKRLRWIEMSYDHQLKSISGVDHGFLENPTCFNDKVYAAVCDDRYQFVMQIDIVVKGKEVIINLLPFLELPFPSFNRCPTYGFCSEFFPFLKGYGTELFYMVVDFKDETKKTIGGVFLFKLDVTRMIWEEMEDLKDAIFFLELTSHYIFYRPAHASELGGYIHILLGEVGKVIHSFNVKNRTISISSMPCLVPETQVSTWAMLEWRLKVDNADSKKEQEDKDVEIVVKGDEGESHLLDIPFHLLEMIMELCIGLEYMNFRATSKHCHLAAPPIQWTNKTRLRFQMTSLVSPWLMVLDNNRRLMTFIDPICGNKYFIKTPPELSGDYQIYYSRYGWLLLYEVNGPLVFFNPFTSDIRELPGKGCYLNNYCFSSPPTSPDCMVVGFITKKDTCVFINFVSRDSSSWLLFIIDDINPYYLYFPTFYGRDLYVLRNGGGVEVFREMEMWEEEEGEEDVSREYVVVKDPKSCCRLPTQYFFANCDQHFFLVIVGEFGESVEVFKLNDSRKEWEKINGLGKHMIYICDTTCVCTEAKSPEMENKIYFPRLENNEKIVFYSLETCRYHTFNGKNIQETFGDDLFTTKHHCNPHTWIEPSWS